MADRPLQDGAYRFYPELIALFEGRAEYVERIHEVAARLIDRYMERGLRGLAVCGVSSGVGVTFISANLALALAQDGIEVLLIDANLRRPGLQRFIEPASAEPGLRQLLEDDQLQLVDVVHQDVAPHLSLIYAGGASRDAADLVGRPAFERLIQDSLRQFQIVIVDTPAANRSAETGRIASVLGSALIVAKRNVSFIDDVAILRTELAKDGASVAGALLNAPR